jgi:Ni,Fe-hydrogenase I small subunit
LGPNKSNKNPKSSIAKKIENLKTRLIIEVLGCPPSHPVQITTCEGAIALDKYRTLGRTIRIEIKRAILFEGFANVAN